MKSLIKNIISGIILTIVLLEIIFIIGNIITFITEHLSFVIIAGTLLIILFILHKILD